jgi:hypothetical protein
MTFTVTPKQRAEIIRRDWHSGVYTRIDDARCPLCGGGLHWGCGADYRDTGSARCEKFDDAECSYRGGRTVRGAAGEVYLERL